MSQIAYKTLSDNTSLVQNIHGRVNFFSSSEADLCTKILRSIYSNAQSIYVSMPAYAQDYQFAKRIGDYIQLSNTRSVVIDAKNKNITQIISEYAYQLDLESHDNIYNAFGQLMRDYFYHNRILHSVIYNAQNLSKQDVDYLYELASLIYEKFPKQKKKPLIRFVFIGDDQIGSILRKKTNGVFDKFSLPQMTITEAINALYLFTPPHERTELFYQTTHIYALAILKATAGYPALLRKIMPFSSNLSSVSNDSLKDYLIEMVNKALAPEYLPHITAERQKISKEARLHIDKLLPFKNIALVVSVGIIFLIYLLFF